MITIPPNDKVVVILNGQIVMREHRLDSPEDFEVKFVGKSGHILFNKDLDDGNSNQPLIWPVVYSHSAQFALIDRNVFENMWKDARDREREVVLSQTNLHSFFQKISK